MSEHTTQPASSSPAVQQGNSPEYREHLRSALGGRPPLEILEQTPTRLGELLRGRSAAFLRRRPFAGKWTPTEIVGHLLDSEWVFGYRIRAVLGDDEPRIISMDQDAWVRSQRHAERDAHELLEQFAALRRANLDFWRRVPADALSRRGVHENRGAESLGEMLEMEAGHDLSHLDQLRRYVAALDAASPETAACP